MTHTDTCTPSLSAQVMQNNYNVQAIVEVSRIIHVSDQSQLRCLKLHPARHTGCTKCAHCTHGCFSRDTQFVWSAVRQQVLY